MGLPLSNFVLKNERTMSIAKEGSVLWTWRVEAVWQLCVLPQSNMDFNE